MYYGERAASSVGVCACMPRALGAPVAATLRRYVCRLRTGTLRCTKENEAFREHYKQLQLAFSQPAGQQQHQQWRPPEQPQDAQAPSSGWRPPPDEQRWQPRQQLQQEGGGYQPQAQPQPKRWWWG